MTGPSVGVDVSGGQIQGIVGAGSVVIENLTFYSRAPEEPAQAAGAEPIGPCPYPGLAYFGPNDADLFFGRDTAIARLIEAVGKQSFTALMGASGSGKSSVVLAGLAPRLNSAGNWRFSHFRVGTELEANPFLALARALAPLYVASDSDVERLKNTKLLASSLEAGELTLRDVFADCRSRNKGRRILLIADQFEEVFTTVADEATRTRFIDVLLAGFADPTAGGAPDICLILTMRADFYGRALRHRPLADALQGHVENLGPMNREELQTAIVRPAQNAGVTFEPGVVETLLDTVQSKPGGLPLLQFALREMWGRQERKKITRKSYDEIGGVEGALAQRAETVFAGLTRNDADPIMDKAFQRLFTRLVTLGEGQEDTRRVVERTELGEEVWGLAQRLAGEENRLVVTNASTARETAEVVHEALIRHWPRLVDWINRDRAFQSWLRQIASGIELWSAAPDDEGPLLRGGMLAQAMEWLARRRDDLSGKERAYIEASVALRQRLESEKEAARQAELTRQQELAEAAQRLAEEQRRRTKFAVVTLSAVAATAAVAIGLAVLAVSARNEATEATERAKAEAENAQDQAVRARAQTRSAQLSRALMVAGSSMRETEAGRAERGLLLALAVDPGRALRNNLDIITRDEVPALAVALERAIYAGVNLRRFDLGVDITSAAFGAEGRTIVAASNDKTVKILDAETGQELRALTGHQEAVRTATVSTDGRRIVTASDDKTARIWDAETGQELRTLNGHESKLWSAVFSIDGRRVATASSDNTARIWDAETGQELRVLKGHEKRIYSAAFSVDGGRVVTASADNTARIWDESGNELGTLTHESEVNNAAFSPAGRYLVTTSDDNKARVWDAESRKLLRTFTGHQDEAYGITFSPNGVHVTTTSKDRTVRIWDIETGTQVRMLGGHTDRVWSAAFSPDSRRIVTASTDKTVRIWDAEIGQSLRALSGHTERVNSAALSADGRHIVTASDDKTVRLWNAETGQQLRSIALPGLEASSAAFSADRKRIVTTSADNAARIWDAESGQELRALTGHERSLNYAAFSPDGRLIVTASRDGTARIWNADTGEQLRVLKGHGSFVNSAAFSANGRRVVTSSADTTARVWDAETGEELHVLTGHEHAVWGAEFAPDGRRIATTGDDKTARVWDAETGKELRVFRGHQHEVYGVAFSPDGRRMVTASVDKTARIWDVQTGLEVHALIGHQEAVYRIAISADGRRLVTASADNTTRIWALLPTVSESWELARKLKHRDLSDSERREFYLSQ